MTREPKQTGNPISRGKAGIEVAVEGDTVLVTVTGLVDEHFAGFGNIGDSPRNIVLNVSGMTRMTSFGVRQWLRAMQTLPKTVTDLYLLGCPTFFVDQLNMVLNFGANAQVLTVVAPYTCPMCGAESSEPIDVLANRTALAKGSVPDKECARCGGKLEFDETPESYFSFVPKYAATTLDVGVGRFLAARALYNTAVDAGADKPPRIIKLVHGSVTYFRIIGTIGSVFRARPFLVGAEGEVVIDLADVDHFDATGLREWRRLIKSLAGQVPAITLVDISEEFLAIAGDTLTTARNVSVWSVLVPFRCVDCGRVSRSSQSLERAIWPLRFADQVCTTCGGTTHNETPPNAHVSLQKAATECPPASAKLIQTRDEILSRALTDANVAQAGEGATATIAADDTILGKYKIVRRLSAGGMAEVFLAKQIGIGGFEKPVALKRIQRKLLETRHLAIDLFLNEAKIVGRLTHPNIVQVLDVGEVGGALYLAMEYVRGRDLRDVVKKLRSTGRTMPLGEACFVVREVAQALHHAFWSTDLAGNRLAVVHRDVSPHNIILSYEGTVKLLDFGVALSAVTEEEQTMVVGKWLYMSPEHSSSRHVDHRSDLFSLGVIAYLLCTGTMPFSGSDPKDIVRKVRAGQYTPVKQVAPDLPPALADLITRMLAPNPDDRLQTGQEVVMALNEITRSYGIESSVADMAEMLSMVLPDETEPIEVSRPSRPELSAVSGASELVGRGTASPSPLANSASPMGFSSASPLSFSNSPSPLRRDSNPSFPSNPSSSFPSLSSLQVPDRPSPQLVELQPRWVALLKGVVIVAILVLLGISTYLLAS